MSFRSHSQTALQNRNLQEALRRAQEHYFKARARSLEGLDGASLREDCTKIREEALSHLDHYCLQFEEKFRANGGEVLWAEDARAARELVLKICKENRVQKVVKGKSMTTEEIELNDFLKLHHIDPIETDLGEYIVQLAGEKPSHLTAPAIHKTREEISALFHEKLNTASNLSPDQLVAVARRKLREEFFEASAGITGGNFLVAETGTMVLVENEGNIAFSTTIPPVHIAIVGIEKVIPRMNDLPLLLRALARSSTGQKMTSYVSLIGGPSEGCLKRYVLLLDNGRSKMLADEKMREALRCIHCGACLNACPVYQHAGGHSYHSVYPGPIGSIWTPMLYDTAESHQLPYASSLCGACSEVCPVKIPIPHLFLELRKRWTRKRIGFHLHSENVEKIAFAGWAALAKNSRLYRWLFKDVARFQKWLPMNEKILKTIPLLSRWGKNRKVPRFATQSFTEWWKRRKPLSPWQEGDGRKSDE